LSDTPACYCLSYLLVEDYEFTAMNIYVKNYIFFQKGNLPPIQVDSSKVSYTDLELSSYAVQVGEDEVKFIRRFEFVMKAYEIFRKKSED